MTDDAISREETQLPEDITPRKSAAKAGKKAEADEAMSLPTVILPRDGDESLQKAKRAAQAISDNRGKDVVILDMRKLSPAFDYFVIATGASNRQLHAMSDAVDDIFEKELKLQKLGMEGYRESRWILLDYGDVVIHLFDADTRDYFRLEQLWGGAEPVTG